MTSIEKLYVSGKNEGIIQSVRLTPIKKITADEIEFYSGDEKMGIDFALGKFLKDKDILIKGKHLSTGGNFCVRNYRHLLWHGSSEKTADSLFNELAAFSKEAKINFLVNYHCVQEEDVNGEKRPVIIFHPEVIINGKRLINDFPDIDLNRRYIVLGKWQLQDITYRHPERPDKPSDENPAPVKLKNAAREICRKMLTALDDYFNVDYRVSLLFGVAKNEYTGLAPDVRKAIINAF